LRANLQKSELGQFDFLFDNGSYWKQATYKSRQRGEPLPIDKSVGITWSIYDTSWLKNKAIVVHFEPRAIGRRGGAHDFNMILPMGPPALLQEMSRLRST
jgi:hypothetical protein